MAWKQLGAIEIDGTTNVVNTDYALYTVPAGLSVVVSKIIGLNKNSGTTVTVRIYHVPSGGSVGNAYAIVYDYGAAQLGPGNLVEIPAITMAAGDKLYVRSNTSLVNFIAWGDER